MPAKTTAAFRAEAQRFIESNLQNLGGDTARMLFVEFGKELQSAIYRIDRDDQMRDIFRRFLVIEGGKK